jgi:hypothetical protein
MTMDAAVEGDKTHHALQLAFACLAQTAIGGCALVQLLVEDLKLLLVWKLSGA